MVQESPLTLPRQTCALTDFAIWKNETRLLCIAQSLGLRGLIVKLTVRWSLSNFSPAPIDVATLSDASHFESLQSSNPRRQVGGDTWWILTTLTV